MNEKQYRIICFYPSEEWAVQEMVMDEYRGNWMSIHHCTEKGKDGYNEVKKWKEENL